MTISAPNREANSAVITGYYAGFRTPDGWCELWPDRGPSLRELFTGARASRPQSPSFADIATQISSLLSPTVAMPERTALSFSASKNRYAQWATDPGAALFTGAAWPAAELARTLRNSGALRVAGPVLSPVAACATGAHTLALGAQLIEDGYADVVLAGAAELEIPPLVHAGYRTLGALSRTGIMRPFDRRRDGFVPGEGAACILLENAEHARRRGAAIHATLAGWSLRADATGATIMDAAGDSIARAIDEAMRRAGAARLDYINAHGTATVLNDVTETRAIRRACGSHVPVSATKPLTGHLLGAGGAVEAVLCLRAMRESYLPPTLNLEDPDPACDLDYIPREGRAAPIATALSLSFGFGGHIGALVLRNAA